MLFDKRRLKFCGLATPDELAVELLLELLTGDEFESRGLLLLASAGLVVSIDGGERPSFRKISSDFSGFFMSGGGFFLNPIAVPDVVVVVTSDESFRFVLDSSSSASDVLFIDALLVAAAAAAITDVRGVGTTVISFLFRDPIEIDDEHTDEADSVDEVEHDLSGFCCSFNSILLKFATTTIKITKISKP